MRFQSIFAVAAASALAIGLPVLGIKATGRPGAPVILKAGETLEARIETPHPVKGMWHQELEYPGAASLKLHLAKLDAGAHDLLLVFDAEGNEVFSNRGPLTEGQWLPSAPGDRLSLEFWPGKSSQPWGLLVDQVGYEYSAARIEGAVAPESICGVDDSKDAICYSTEPARMAAGDPVGRLYFNTGQGWAYCTAFLVSPNGHVLTNNHCVNNESSANSAEFLWRYRYPACGSGTAAYDSKTVGSHFLLTDFDLDFSLLVISSDTPQLKYGYLTPNPNLPHVGDTMWIAGHPMAQPERFSVLSDMDGGGNAKVQGVDIAGNAAGTDIGYYADTQGGSSGSPVMAADNSVIALHHFGINGTTCTVTNMNQGVEMSKVYPRIAPYLDKFFWPTASPVSGYIPLAVSFSANPTGGQTPFAYNWDFGDGSAHSTDQNPSHTYTVASDYKVTLTVTDGAGKSGTDSHLQIHAQSAQVTPPSVTGVSKATNPFRLILAGTNFHPNCIVKIEGVAVPTTVFKNATKVVAKGGAALQAMVPKGVTVSISVTNTDDGGNSSPITYKR